jgi:hypothetical protein
MAFAPKRKSTLTFTALDPITRVATEVLTDVPEQPTHARIAAVADNL